MQRLIQDQNCMTPILAVPEAAGFNMIGMKSISCLYHHRIKVNLVIGVSLSMKLEDVDNKVQEIVEHLIEVSFGIFLHSEPDKKLQNPPIERDPR